MQNHVSKSRLLQILGKRLNFALHQQSVARKAALLFVLAFSLTVISISRSVIAQESSDTQPQLLSQKQVHSIADFTTFNGQSIKEVKLGWESYGELNADKSNAILITHYFTGTSHAAGKYAASDATSGYWDSIIGPNKAIDTNKFFVVSMDSLANLNVKDKNVITTGPASINPATGNPYGLTFPVITMRDMVNTQKSLLESLGIQKLYAVAGPSMGSMQAIEWATAYPDQVERLISVIGSSFSDAWTTAALEQWTIPIKLDQYWQQGNYYKSQPPTEGLTAALMFITQVALTPDYFNQVGVDLKHQPLESKPLMDIQARHGINDWLYNRAKGRAENMDANSLLYLVRACQLFMAGQKQDLRTGLKQMTAKSLFLPATTDLLLMPYNARNTYKELKEMNKDTKIAEIQGHLGHLEGVLNIHKHSATIAAFLAE
ncbi:E22 family MetX-like putative esterase [Brumicola pallidula]|jgi:homoserine O-acetyltransferase|uniref:Probable acyltransferase n=1 Tax=Brumicola pallidula DSM 14239 = ACAM 615 TaxID=1121922 RepID=K6ZHK2_9ALTE|nr:homoserine O-acetyltransferase [Glaciecola pallidula]GAC28373.1 homoserine O-acetyltransferase [Glaciecola pallidula DSM 14239 = ACAM 615]